MSTSADLLSYLPKDSIDSHMHIFNPNTHPLPKTLKPPPYTVPTTPMSGALKLFGAYLPRMVIVQPSTYGTDNSCQLSGLKALGGVNRGGCVVVEVDPQGVTQEVLQTLHNQGARGLRVNFVSRGLDPSPEHLRSTLKRYADLARPLGWVVELYTPMRTLAAMKGLLDNDSLGVPIVLDHFAQPTFPNDIPDSDISFRPEGFSTLLSLVSSPSSNLYVKISASYRFLPSPSPSTSAPILKTLFEAMTSASDKRLVFGTDWPHTRYDQVGRVDTVGLIREVIGWCLDFGKKSEDQIMGKRLVEQVFKQNAEKLWFGRD